MPALHRIHEQRLKAAAEAAIAGREVILQVERGETSFMVWYERGLLRGVRHVIAAGGASAMYALLPAADAELQRAIDELRGAVAVV